MSIRKIVVATIVTICSMLLWSDVNAQQPLPKGKMHYIVSNKPNNILYRDTLYRGVKEFKPLFFRTGDEELITLYKKHQRTKVTGQIVGLVGSIATIWGASKIGSGERGLGWALFGGGFAGTLAGGYMIMDSQRKLALAVDLFNDKHNKTAFGIGVADKQLGLVYKF